MGASNIGLIGRKVGMTQVFQDDGTMVAVCVLAIEPNTVTRLRTTDRDGYTAVQLGTEVVKKLTKPEAGQLKDLPKVATIREFRVDNVDDYKVGQTLSIEDLFAAGDDVDVTGVSKGKGFAGHIKRHNFHRGPKTHGSDHHREPGLDRPGHDPGSRLPRPQDGRPHGRRAGDHQEGARRAHRSRPQPAARQGEPPRRARLADPREEGLTMPQTNLYDRTGKTVGSVELSDELFAAPINAAVLHQVVTAQLAGRRTGTADTKTRGEVRGGGKKPYRQKGTGRARQGSVSAPHYRGGGVVFGPHPRSYEQRLPRKMKRLALRGALTAKFGDEQLKVIDTFGLEAIKTKALVGVLAALDADGRVLVVAPGRDEKLELSARNLPTVEVILADSLNVVDLLNADLVLIEQPALARMDRLRRRHARRCPHERPHRPRDHPAPRHQREVDRRVQPRQVHLRRPQRRQQDPDQGGRRGAVQEGRT